MNANGNANSGNRNNNNNNVVSVVSIVASGGCYHAITFGGDGVVYRIWAEEYVEDNLRDAVNGLMLLRHINGI